MKAAGKEEAKRPTGYAAMVAEAEASVSAVKDPELRRVAFEKILVTLLEGEQARPSVGNKSQSRRAPAASKKGGRQEGAATRKGPKAHIEELIEDGFFDEQRTIAEVKAELANQGRHIAITSLSGPLQKLTQERRLRRQKVGTSDTTSKASYAYSNW